MDDTLLRVNDLTLGFTVGDDIARAVDGVSFTVKRGETYALLGESGCGKSITALSLLQLTPPSTQVAKDSQVILSGDDLLNLSEVAMRRIRGKKIGMIFQEPMSSLNPVLTIGQQISEVLRTHTQTKDIRACVIESLTAVGLPDPEHQFNVYPHQLSGGMKQRVMIAMMLAAEPDCLIADEPTTALDVTIERQVLNLMDDLQTKTGMAIVLITHDLGVVKDRSSRLGMMYAGHLVEQSGTKDFFSEPLHPYSQCLMDALPTKAKRNQPLASIAGQVPPLTEDIKACRFASRCPHAFEACHQVPPAWVEHRPGHHVRCHLYTKVGESRLQAVKDHVPAKPASMQTGSHSDAPLLSVRDLKVYFPIHKGLLKRTVGHKKAVDGISFDCYPGRTLAVVGESGSGKTTLGRAVLQLIKPTAGEILIENKPFRGTRAEFKYLRRHFQIIFQDPFTSMNPRLMVESILAEGIRAQGLICDKKTLRKRLLTLLDEVGLPANSLTRYPHEFSGGQRQRLSIARALAVEPKLIICDEPTSALDISIQAQILNLLQSLQQRHGLSYLFITHNLSVVSYLADEIMVMQHGRVVEVGTPTEILEHPQQAYTQNLVQAAALVTSD
jgi:peptide/nickel transport system ATP-binding protein